jgi:hypothetical protein
MKCESVEEFDAGIGAYISEESGKYNQSIQEFSGRQIEIPFITRNPHAPPFRHATASVRISSIASHHLRLSKPDANALLKPPLSGDRAIGQPQGAATTARQPEAVNSGGVRKITTWVNPYFYQLSVRGVTELYFLQSTGGLQFAFLERSEPDRVLI